MASENRYRVDQELEWNVQSPRSVKNDEILNIFLASFATSGQLGHFRSKRGTYSRSPDFGLKFIPAEFSNFIFYKTSLWSAQTRPGVIFRSSKVTSGRGGISWALLKFSPNVVQYAEQLCAPWARLKNHSPMLILSILHFSRVCSRFFSTCSHQ